MKRLKRQAKTTALTKILKRMRKTTISGGFPVSCQEASEAAGLARNQLYDYETGRVVPTFFKLQQAVAVYGYEIEFKKTGRPKV
mgnify:CR=1 FL=1|tara:strand:- start:1139 stop:1390 length:252 start_codon:yes stop_codon:yes gene_type:complete